MINKGKVLNQNLIEEMSNYFETDKLKFKDSKEEILYIGRKLKEMDIDEISNLINMYGDTLTRYYLEKQKVLGNKFSYDDLEPFINYLDSYLITNSGGSKDELNRLSNYLIGERFDYPTQRLIRLSILDKYFSSYLQ